MMQYDREIVELQIKQLDKRMRKPITKGDIKHSLIDLFLLILTLVLIFMWYVR